jgi:hypothetical protein
MNLSMSETLAVNLAERSYLIHFDRDVGGQISEEIARRSAAGRKVAVLTDENISRAQGAWLQSIFGDASTLVVAPGEASKSIF